MAEQFADIIIDISHEKVDRTFQYRIPEPLIGGIAIGMEVLIPFGAGNTVRSGYVIEITSKPSFDPDRLKNIIGIKENRVSMETNAIQLANWMKEQYGSTMITALKTVLPVKQKVKEVEKRTIHLLVEKEEAVRLAKDFSSKRQIVKGRILDALSRNNPLSYHFVIKELKATSKILTALEEQKIIQIQSERQYRNPFMSKLEEKKDIVLSEEQESIIRTIKEERKQGIHKTYLIHGITGSGKTQVYIETIRNVIASGQQAILLIPEIALTYQTVSRFYEAFPDRVSVMNSKLSQGEKYDQMMRAKKGEIDVIIGPRSALFTPFQKLGIIIVDEEHEASYKSETMPRYHARSVAKQLAKMHKASLVLGSATPSLETYYAVQNGEITLFELTKRLTKKQLPKVYIEDLREELKQGNRSIFSNRLSQMIEERLQKKQQIMLFLNRRGYAGFISCRSCGHVMKCPHCDVSLFEHKNGKYICHYCGYQEKSLTLCPECGSPYLLSFKAGTQQIETMIRNKFPGARVLRMDADTTRTKESYDKILSAFRKQEADILLGTQMIVKGHDFPNVTLVGVMAADLSLSINDYRAAERTFQLLTQAAGRAGRGDELGEVVIQTYQPDHYSIKLAAKQDYKAFYAEEIAYRELLAYPPAYHMLAVIITGKQENRAYEMAQILAANLKEKVASGSGNLIGPAPAGISKIKDTYRYLFYIKHREETYLTKWKDAMEEKWSEISSSEEQISFDFDPMISY